ncbi:MAG: hypothetical protein A2Y40_02990 [Candidatus Margulisbacteria bacterium GWF2_35_9]|nr:MAG: hypothetical protein A2Y40_02990 [Candidatus Margulisbacteria bacterium GWF2_35_9]
MNGLNRTSPVKNNKTAFITVFVLFALIMLSGLLYFRLEILTEKHQQNVLLKDRINGEVEEFNGR